MTQIGRMPKSRGFLALGVAAALLAATPAAATPITATSAKTHAGHDNHLRHKLHFRQWVVDANQSFRGLDAVSRRTAWISGGSLTDGGAGSVWRTTDGGRSWQDVSPAGSTGLQYRDVEARSAKRAVVLAIGPGESSRIYKTTNGGRSWVETFRNTDEAAFYNCMDFYPGGRRGLAVSDSVDGKFRIIATNDWGNSWKVLPDAGMPDSEGEYNFAASGDCLVIRGNQAWFGSGGSAARIFHSRDHGYTWKATDSTIPAGESAGVFGLAFKNPHHGVAVGGDFADPESGQDASAITRNGRSWHNGGNLGLLAEDVAWLSGAGRTLIATGESGDTAGSQLSRNGGRTWQLISGVGFHTLDCTPDRTCWAAGGDGRVGRLLY